MAFSFTNTNYSGKQFQELYTDYVLANNSISKMKLLPGNKGTMNIPSMTIGNILQADSCTFNDSGTVTMDNKSVAVCDLKVNFSLCLADLENQWVSEQLRPGALSGLEMPSTIEEFLGRVTAAKIGSQIEYHIWQGDATGATYNLCDGLEKLFLADSTVVDVTATTITSSNVITELNKVYAALPAEIQSREDLVFYVSASVAKAYRQALASQTAMFNWDITKKNELQFLGIPMVEALGMTAGRIVLTVSENLWYSFDGLADKEEIRMLPMIDTTGDETVRVIARMKHGVNYAYGKYVVFYS